MNSSSSFGFAGSLTSYVLKPNRPVMTSTSLPRTSSNLPSVMPAASGMRVTYSRFDDIAAPGGGVAAGDGGVANALPGAINSAPSTIAATPNFLIRPSLVAHLAVRGNLLVGRAINEG